MPDLNPPALHAHDPHYDDSFNLEHNDEKIFLKAVKLHGPGPLQPDSLKEECMYFFISRAAEWLSIKNKTSINIFDSMPSFLRAQLLEFLAGYVWRNNDCDPCYEWVIHLPPHLICPLINLVIGKNVEKMDLASMMCAFKVTEDDDMNKTDITGGVVDILSKLSEDSPNLQEFTMECFNHRAFSFDQQQLLKLLLMKECKFKNLTALSLRFLGVCESKIGNKQLKDISRNFPLLVYLRLELAKNIKLKALVESLSNLKRLRFFSYNFLDNIEEMRPQRHPLEDKVFNYCAPKLPHLEHLRVVEIPGEQTDFCSEEHSLMFSGTCQLRQLCCVNELPEASLPNLSHLCFKGPILNMAVFDSRVSLYKNLTAVQLQNVEEERVCLLLELVGHQLSVLLLSSPMRFSDFKIVSLCPNLVNLLNCGQAYYRHSLESYLGYADERNVKMMCSLKYLNLDFKGTRAPQGLLKMLLASPKLEKLFISEMLITAKDCRFFSQIKCPSLDRLFFCDMKPTLDCKLAHLEVMVRGLAVHLPSLIAMTIWLDESFRKDAGLAYDWDANVKKYIDLFMSLIN